MPTNPQPERAHPVARRRALRSIAVFEAFKGIAALGAGLGLLSLLHHDLHHLAIELIGHFHLDPASRYPTIVLRYADALQDANLRSLVALGIGYVVLRLLEAYGLWFETWWGEWLAALSGAVYIPLEVRHLLYRPTAIGAAVLLGNLFVVAFLAHQLWHRMRHRRVDAATGTATSAASRQSPAPGRSAGRSGTPRGPSSPPA